MTRKSITLMHLIDDYEECRELSDVYVQSLRCSVRRFEKHLGRPATINDFKHKEVNRYLKAERDAGRLADRSRYNSRKDLITIWKFSGRKLKIDKIRRVSVAKKNPSAWYYDQLVKVITAALDLPGGFPNGLPRSLYMATILRFAFETGIRRRDIWSFDVSLLADNVAAITQHKTKHVQVVQVTDALMGNLIEMRDRLIAAGDTQPTIVFRWPMSERQFYYWMRRCRVAAGVDANVANRALQHLRRTGATEVDRNGGEAWKFLGHTTSGLDRKSYIDAVKNRKPLSPVMPAQTTEQTCVG